MDGSGSLDPDADGAMEHSRCFAVLAFGEVELPGVSLATWCIARWCVTQSAEAPEKIEIDANFSPMAGFIPDVSKTIRSYNRRLTRHSRRLYFICPTSIR